MSTAPYDAIAMWYDTLVRDESHAGNLPYLMEFASGVREKMICGLASRQGRMATSILRPANSINPRILIEGFWRSKNLAGLRAKIGAHHRMLSTYFNALPSAGFTLERCWNREQTRRL